MSIVRSFKYYKAQLTLEQKNIIRHFTNLYFQKLKFIHPPTILSVCVTLHSVITVSSFPAHLWVEFM